MLCVVYGYVTEEHRIPHNGSGHETPDSAVWWPGARRKGQDWVKFIRASAEAIMFNFINRWLMFTVLL